MVSKKSGGVNPACLVGGWWSSGFSGEGGKGENAPGRLGSSLWVIPGRLPLQRRNRGQKQPSLRSDSGLAAEGVFRLFRSGLVKIPNAFAFFPFSSANCPDFR